MVLTWAPLAAVGAVGLWLLRGGVAGSAVAAGPVRRWGLASGDEGYDLPA